MICYLLNPPTHNICLNEPTHAKAIWLICNCELDIIPTNLYLSHCNKFYIYETFDLV